MYQYVYFFSFKLWEHRKSKNLRISALSSRCILEDGCGPVDMDICPNYSGTERHRRMKTGCLPLTTLDLEQLILKFSNLYIVLGIIYPLHYHINLISHSA
jgi:hypothetical protein